MVLIRTHDGMLGWKRENKIHWMASESHAKTFGIAMWEMSKDEAKTFYEDFTTAIETLKSSGYTTAHFGVFGGFMYCEPEID